MAAARVAPSPSSVSTRTPLLPSDSDNTPRRPKGSKVVSSRYLSSCSSTKRCPSPSPGVSRGAPGAAAAPLVRRSQSAERQRTATQRPGPKVARDSDDGRISSVQRTLASVRSLSVSFQGESYSVSVDKVKAAGAEKPMPAVTVRPTSSGGGRKGTPERRRIGMLATPRASADNLKAVMEQKHRWPGRSAMSKSLDFGSILTLSHRTVARDLENSMMVTDVRGSRNEIDGTTDSKLDTRLRSEGHCSNNGSLEIGLCRIGSGNDTDSETASSSSISSAKQSNGHAPCASSNIGGALHGIRGIKVQARFAQEPSNRLAQRPSPMAAAMKLSSTPKIISTKRPGSDSPLASPKGYAGSRRQASPSRGAVRPASPSKFASLSMSSPARGLSPSRVRDVSEENVISAPSMLRFAVEARRGKMGDCRIFNAHALRLLHNRLLQWRFVNARADYALFLQTLNAERSLCNSWVKISNLRESVKAKALQLQMLRHILKLSSVLNGQTVYLEKWASMDRDYSSSLSGATEALHASTLRLPVIGGARVNVRKLKDAINSALEMLQAMGTSVCLSSSKVGRVHTLVTELADVTLRERALLVHCRDLLSSNAALQINESSLRSHILQQTKVSSVGRINLQPTGSSTMKQMILTAED
ncbi:hypothetical protein MLD38_002047 [Melastoma candidum]|uniref:Uncharacterized protein n=1 Tax=Melastoma candidum TaxID=119954 RepID=A0ACB9SGR6_9MYRT|nr:hypothetical protein MLD38_002047 [Melastoma candidum]